MALPTRETTLLDPKTPLLKSYANAVEGKIKQSLLHSDLESPHLDDVSSMKTVTSRIFRSSRTYGAFLFDISQRFPHYTEQQVMMVTKEKHPNCHSCIPLKDSTRSYPEVYIDKEDDENDIAETGLTFSKLKLRILPCKAIRDASRVVNVKLSHLPLFKKEKVLQGLKDSLAPFGQLLDVGIFIDNATKFFMGNGYAVLDVTNCKGETSYQQLTHVINWRESIDDAFHATWNNMPTWCRYCHQEGHTKYDCALSKAKIICYTCHKQGHCSFECPRKATDIKAFKKARKEKRPGQTPEQNAWKASKELMKSIYAKEDQAPDTTTGVPATEDKEDPDYTPPAEDDSASDSMSVVTNDDDDISMGEIDDLHQDQAKHDQPDAEELPEISEDVKKVAPSTSSNNRYETLLAKPHSQSMSSVYLELCRAPKSNLAESQKSDNLAGAGQPAQEVQHGDSTN